MPLLERLQWSLESYSLTSPGNLDTATGQKVVELLFEINRDAGTTLILVTHDANLAQQCDRSIRLEAGKCRQNSAREATALRVAVTMLRRELRGGELGLLISAMIIAVGTVTTIGFFVDRLQRALALESASFIAADRVLSSSNPIPAQYAASASALGLETTRTVEFLSMAFSEDRAQLGSVKAVDEGYPSGER